MCISRQQCAKWWSPCRRTSAAISGHSVSSRSMPASPGSARIPRYPVFQSNWSLRSHQKPYGIFFLYHKSSISLDKSVCNVEREKETTTGGAPNAVILPQVLHTGRVAKASACLYQPLVLVTNWSSIQRFHVFAKIQTFVIRWEIVYRKEDRQFFNPMINLIEMKSKLTSTNAL